MDSNNSAEGENVEKANAISIFRRIQEVTTFVRLVEVSFLLLVLFSRFHFQVASSLKVTGECVRGVIATLTSTRFVFVLGNVIVIALYVISSRCPPKDDEHEPSSGHLYEEYADKCQLNQPPPLIVEEKRKEGEDVPPCSVLCVDKKVIIGRSQSEKNAVPEVVQAAAPRRKFRRSRSENIRRIGVVLGKKYATAAASFRSYAEDDMTSEEFRQTVEAFIARQQRVLREEELSAAFSA